MLSIHIFVCVPFPGEKWSFSADDFSSKKRGERWVFLKDKVAPYLQSKFLSWFTLPFYYKQICQWKILTDMGIL